VSDTKSTEDFEKEQAKARETQGITSDDVVPEQRPQAFTQVDPSQESDLYKARKEAGDFDPADKSAYDKAASIAQLKKAEKAEQKLGNPNLREGAVVKITDGIYEGAIGTITKVNYEDEAEAAKAASGVPGAANFAKAESFMVRSRGGAHALISVKAKDVELVPGGFTNTQSVV
jgi:hypothetical protein